MDVYNYDVGKLTFPLCSYKYAMHHLRLVKEHYTPLMKYDKNKFDLNLIYTYRKPYNRKYHLDNFLKQFCDYICDFDYIFLRVTISLKPNKESHT